MKLRICSSLRTALLSCYAAASFTVSIPAVPVIAGIVGMSLISSQAEAAITVGTLAGGQIDPRTGTPSDYVLTNFTYGWFGGGTFGWTAPIIYIQSWKQTSGSNSEKVVVNGDLKDANLLSADYTGGNIEIAAATITFEHDHVFNGAHYGFSGDFIMSVNHIAGGSSSATQDPGTDSTGGKDFVFTNRDLATATEIEKTNISGTGAIEFGIRAAGDGLAANNNARNAIYFYTGDVSIGNSVINADTLSLNGLNTGDNTSTGYKASRITSTGTDGASYTITSRLNIDTLEINDGSTAILTGNGASAASTVGVVTFAGASSLTVGNQSTLTLTGTQTIGENQLSVLDGGQLTIDGRLNLTGSITLSGILDFGTTGILDLNGLSRTAEGDGYIYDINTLTTGDTGEISGLTWDRILGVNGISSSSTISYSNGKLTLSGILAPLEYTGTDSSSSPRALAWNTEGAFDGDTFTTGRGVIFNAHTSATLSADTVVGALELEATSSLSINSAGHSLRIASIAMENSSQMRIDYENLDLSDGSIYVSGTASNTLSLDGGSGVTYNIANVFNLVDYEGELNLNSATAYLTDISQLGATTVFTLSESAILDSAGLTFTRRIHVGGDSTIRNSSGTTSLAQVTGANDKTLTLDGAVTFSNNIDFEGAIIINSGTTKFGTNQGSTNTLSAASITVKNDAQFTIAHRGSDFTSTAFYMEGGTLFSGDIDKTYGGIQFGTLTTSGSNTIKHEYDGSFIFTDLTGGGTLTFDGDASTWEVGVLKFLNVTNYDGSVNFGTGDSADKLIFTGTISQSADQHMILGGRFRADIESATFSGEGTTSFNTGLRLTGTNVIQSGTVNVSGMDFSTNSTLTVLGGRLHLNAASFVADAEGTLRLGSATVGSSEANVSFADNIEIGASTIAGTAESPTVTTIHTTQSDSADALALHITGNITETTGSVGRLSVTGAGSLTLSGDNSFTGGLHIAESTVILGSTTAAGQGIIELAGGSLNAGAQAIENTVNYSGGALSGMSSFAGTLNVNANLSISDAISGTINIASGVTLDLDGTWKYSNAIENAGTLTFGADMVLDITDAVFTEGADGLFTLQIVNGEGLINTNDWLTGETVDKSNLVGTLAGRTFTYSDGVLSYTIDSKDLTWNGNDLDLAVGKVFSEGGAFADGDNMIFSENGITALTVTQELSSGTVTLKSGATVTSEAASYGLHIDNLNLESGASFDMDSNVTASIIAMADNTTLTMASLSELISASLAGSAHLIVEDAQATGAVTIDTITGGADASLSIALSSDGSTLEMENFTGNLLVTAGSMHATTADKTDFASVTLGSNASYKITDTLALYSSTAQDLGYIKGGDDSTLILSLSGSSDNFGNRSAIQLSDEFTGSLEILTGTLSALSSTLNGVSSITLHHHTGFAGDPAGYTTKTLHMGVEIVSGATAYAHVWGSERVLELAGALSGDSSTTLRMDDGGILKLSGDMTNYRGTLDISGNKVLIDTDATNLNKISMTGSYTLEVTGGHTVSTSGVDNGLRIYNKKNDDTTNSETFAQNIIVGANSTLTDNVYIRLGQGTINVSGGGTYSIAGFMGSDRAADHESNLNIAENTTLIVTNTNASSSASDLPAFLLGHYSNTNGHTAVSVSGKLELNSGISSYHGTGTITINGGGTLTLNKGLYGIDNGNTAGAINIVAAADSTLELGNQETASNAGVVTVDVAAGATIKAIAANTNVLNKIDLSGNGTVTLTGSDSATSVVLNGVLAQKEGSTTGLKFVSTTNQSFTLNGANSYTGGTIIEGATVTAGHAAAFGTGGGITVTSGALNINGQAVSNDITVNGGDISGLSAYAGTVTFNATNTISDTITGNIVITESGSLTLNGEWDFTSAITNQGTLNIGAGFTLDLEGASFTYFEGKYSLDLFTGSSTTNFGTQFSSSMLSGVTTEGYEFSYENGVLSYREVLPTEGDIIVANATDKSVEGENIQNIILETSSSKVYLGGGFTQRPEASISGGGEVHIASGETATLSNANSYTGDTLLGEGSTLIVELEEALGSGDIKAGANSSIEIAAGTSMSNDVDLAEGASLQAGVLTVTGRAGDTSSVHGTESTVEHDASGVGSIRKATMTDVNVLLAADGTGEIHDTVLTNTRVTLGNNSNMTIQNSIQGFGTRIENNSATVNLIDHTMQVSTATGGLSIAESQEITTLQGAKHNMTVYTVDTVAVENVVATGTFTLDVVLDSAQHAIFMTKFDAGDFLAFEIVDVALEDMQKIWYHDVIINIYNGGLDQEAVTINPLAITEHNLNVVFFIPEPSTATLSLLALAALAARRRRKDD